MEGSVTVVLGVYKSIIISSSRNVGLYTPKIIIIEPSISFEK